MNNWKLRLQGFLLAIIVFLISLLIYNGYIGIAITIAGFSMASYFSIKYIIVAVKWLVIGSIGTKEKV